MCAREEQLEHRRDQQGMVGRDDQHERVACTGDRRLEPCDRADAGTRIDAHRDVPTFGRPAAQRVADERAVLGPADDDLEVVDQRREDVSGACEQRRPRDGDQPLVGAEPPRCATRDDRAADRALRAVAERAVRHQPRTTVTSTSTAASTST